MLNKHCFGCWLLKHSFFYWVWYFVPVNKYSYPSRRVSNVSEWVTYYYKSTKIYHRSAFDFQHVVKISKDNQLKYRENIILDKGRRNKNNDRMVWSCEDYVYIFNGFSRNARRVIILVPPLKHFNKIDRSHQMDNHNFENLTELRQLQMLMSCCFFQI